MRRLALLAIFASSGLHATSVMTATCSVGTTTRTVIDPSDARCMVPLVVDGVEVAFAAAEASLSGDLSSGLSVAANGGFGSESISSSSSDIGGGGIGTASYSQFFSTPGPSRPGFISAYFNFGFHGFPTGSLTQNGMGHGNGGPGIGPTIPEPFQLGEPFEVSLSASEGGGGQFPCEEANCAGDTFASVTVLQITEADGITPVPYFEVAPAPEPASWQFLLLGFAACAVFYVRFWNAGSGSLKG